MTVVALADCLTGYHSFWIRVGQYLKKLSDKYKITITDDIKYIDTLNDKDVLIIYRYSLEWGDLTEKLIRAKDRGVRIICDVDDYLWNDGDKRGWKRERLKQFTRALKQSNMITCSTEVLKTQLEVMFKKQTIKLIKNTAPAKTRQKISSIKNSKIRIGWTGAPWTRPYDMKILGKLNSWLEKNEDRIEIIHIGHSDLNMSLAMAIKVKEKLIKKIPLCTYDLYMEQFEFDIGLAPLAENCFNSFKSAIKVMEYSANSIPWIASDVEVYRQLCNDWNWQGRLCRTTEDWIINMEELINDDHMREEEGKKLKYICEKNSSHQNGVDKWNQLLTSE